MHKLFRTLKSKSDSKVGKNKGASQKKIFGKSLKAPFNQKYFFVLEDH